MLARNLAVKNLRKTQKVPVRRKRNLFHKPQAKVILNYFKTLLFDKLEIETDRADCFIKSAYFYYLVEPCNFVCYVE